MVKVAAVSVVALVIVLPISAQNLVVNPGFDNADQLTNWTCTIGYGVSTWNPLDRNGSGLSGSMQHDLSEPDINRSITCTQCVGPVTEFDGYIASTWIHWPDDADVTQTGSSRISYGFFTDAGCTTAIEWCPISIAYFPSQPLGVWIFFPTVECVAPAGSVAARVTITTWQPLANEPLRARIDDVGFHTTTIFRDGFESGNTTGWEP